MCLSPRQRIHALTAAALLCLMATAQAGTEDEVRAVFDRFVQVQNAHDVKAVETLLADSMLGVGRSIQDDLGCAQKPPR